MFVASRCGPARGLGGGAEGDAVAEAFGLRDEPPAVGLAVLLTVEPVGSEVVVLLVADEPAGREGRRTVSWLRR